MRPMPSVPPLTDPVLEWYEHAARDLPWRAPGVGAWAVLVSEIMLQQTPVARVEPVYQAWLARWPTPTALAAEPAGEAVRMWGRLGYPRRALRLHGCATAVRDRFAGQVPSDVAALLELPGIGAYTARAIAAFAFGQRVPVVDTNVRRVVARAVGGQGTVGPPSTSRDLALVEALLPESPRKAARFSVGLMELGALVCVARTPRCSACPISDRCAWVRAGSPVYDGPTARPQGFAGTDRQVRGLLMDVLRRSAEPVAKAALDVVWQLPAQRERALDSLVSDGLIDPLPDGRYALPGHAASASAAPSASAPASPG
jgi:A/G-specific adenine glycosylase